MSKANITSASPVEPKVPAPLTLVSALGTHALKGISWAIFESLGTLTGGVKVQTIICMILR